VGAAEEGGRHSGRHEGGKRKGRAGRKVEDGCRSGRGPRAGPRLRRSAGPGSRAGSAPSTRAKKKERRDRPDPRDEDSSPEKAASKDRAMPARSRLGKTIVGLVHRRERAPGHDVVLVSGEEPSVARWPTGRSVDNRQRRGVGEEGGTKRPGDWGSMATAGSRKGEAELERRGHKGAQWVGVRRRGGGKAVGRKVPVVPSGTPRTHAGTFAPRSHLSSNAPASGGWCPAPVPKRLAGCPGRWVVETKRGLSSSVRTRSRVHSRCSGLGCVSSRRGRET